MAEKEQPISGAEEPRYVPSPSRRDLKTGSALASSDPVETVLASSDQVETTSDQLELEEVVVLVQERHFNPNLSSSASEVADLCSPPPVPSRKRKTAIAADVHAKRRERVEKSQRESLRAATSAVKSHKRHKSSTPFKKRASSPIFGSSSSLSGPKAGVKLMKVTPRRSIQHRSSNGELSSMKETMIFDGQVRVALEAGQGSELEQANEYPERINTDRATDIFCWCVCNPFSWFTLLFSHWSEKLWTKSTQEADENRRKSHRIASWTWGKWSVDCGLLAFAFNFLCFVGFLVVLWVWFLNLGGVSFKLVSKWGRAPDAPIDQVQFIAPDEVNF